MHDGVRVNDHERLGRCEICRIKQLESIGRVGDSGDSLDFTFVVDGKRVEGIGACAIECHKRDSRVLRA